MKSLRHLRVAPPTWGELLGGAAWLSVLDTQIKAVSIPMVAFAFFSGGVIVRALKQKV